MPRLTKQQIVTDKMFLTEWHTPDETMHHVKQVNNHAGRYFLIQSGIGFLRDAWAAAKFGHILQAASVRLVPEENRWPDFELRFGNQIRSFELVEADIPGRRRGDEYLQAETAAGPDGLHVVHDPVENWVARANQVPTALIAAADKKISKNYGASSELLIYLNIHEYGIRQKQIEAIFPTCVRAALPHFIAVWILWKDQVYGPWSKARDRLVDDHVTRTPMIRR